MRIESLSLRSAYRWFRGDAYPAVICGKNHQKRLEVLGLVLYGLWLTLGSSTLKLS